MSSMNDALLEHAIATDRAELHDRLSNGRLQVDLIPQGTWGKNVRTLAPDLWPAIRKKALAAQGRRCASCQNVPRKSFHVHEQWAFEYLEGFSGVQKLVGFEVLCETCHAVKHAGRTIATREDGVAFVLNQLAECNRWTKGEAREHLEEAFRIWDARNLLAWSLDLSYAAEYLYAEAGAPTPPAGPAADG